VVWDSHGLRIVASNSSLAQILKDVTAKTGATLEGMGKDERIFGTYGPGLALDVLSLLLDGSGYNILLVGDLGQGTPRRIVLSGRPTGPAPPPAQSNADADEEQMAQPEAQPTGPMSQPDMPGAIPPPPVPARSQMMMQQRREQMEQQQQQQNNPQNPQN